MTSSEQDLGHATMSDLFRATIAKLPAHAELMSLEEDPAQEEGEEGYFDGDRLQAYDEGSSSSSASSASSTATIRAPSAFARPELKSKKRDLEPIPWNHYFSQKLSLSTSQNIAFITNAYHTPATFGGPLFVTHHGAGSSGLSFALVASEIRKLLPAAGILSIDARGHGETTTENDSDLSLDTLSTDLVAAVSAAKLQLEWDQLPDMVLIGHSLGGAVIADVAKRKLLGPSLLAYAVIDVVEGSAIDALQSMQTYLSTRPTSFTSLMQAIEWHVRSRTLRNRLSARVSVPALVYDSHDAASARPWLWRTNLAATQPFWESWFVGLSRKFLEGQGGKLLILAGTDRLDKELMIGQMQGKYQLLVLPEVGHFVHEDAPEKTASALVEFYKRNDRSALVLPKKVGEV